MWLLGPDLLILGIWLPLLEHLRQLPVREKTSSTVKGLSREADEGSCCGWPRLQTSGSAYALIGLTVQDVTSARTIPGAPDEHPSHMAAVHQQRRPIASYSVFEKIRMWHENEHIMFPRGPKTNN